MQREPLAAREVSLRRALQLAALHESHGKGHQSEETLRALLTIKDDKIAALERCVRELETQLRRYSHSTYLFLIKFIFLSLALIIMILFNERKLIFY